MKRDEKGGKCKKWFTRQLEFNPESFLNYVGGTITNSGSNNIAKF